MDTHEDDCPTCEGKGVIYDYNGVYGTSNCTGPTEDICKDCRGTGENYA